MSLNSITRKMHLSPCESESEISKGTGIGTGIGIREYGPGIGIKDFKADQIPVFKFLEISK